MCYSANATHEMPGGVVQEAPKAVNRMMLSNRTRQVLDTDAWTALQ
jgi:hypothetical protein